MREQVILDTGPLVAFLNKGDHYHAWAKEIFNEIKPPLLTCEAVISEACFLVRKFSGGHESIFKMLAADIIRIVFNLQAEIDPVRKVLVKYVSVPASLADACLVRMAEIHSQSLILTLDSDFQIYRKSNRQVVRYMAPG